MKKKWIVGIVVVVVLIIGGFVVKSMMKSSTVEEAGKSAKVDDGIDYFDVPDVEQVYINGVVTPDQTESFAKNEKLGTQPEIKVNNGDIVDQGTVLFTYEDKEITQLIEEQNNTVSRNQTKRSNTIARRDKALANFNATPEEERTTSKSAIESEYTEALATIDEDIQFSTSTIANLKEKQYVNTTAKFKGQVAIPEIKDANAPILKLTSEGYYVSGKVNEKDLAKITIDQKANIQIVPTGKTVGGKITYIDNNPPETAGAEGAADATAGAEAGMSSYLVKLALDSFEGVKNGYHVQATINLSNDPIEIPTKAIQTEGDIRYVLVNDFGSVIRREIQTGEEKGKNTVVTSGLESADKVIVSSKKKVKEGDLLEGDHSDKTDAANGNVTVEN